MKWCNAELHAQDIHNKYTRFIEKEVSKTIQKEPDNYEHINMSFTDNNYETIQDESNWLGINLSFFVNSLIRIIHTDDINKYIKLQPIKRTKDNIPRKKGSASKRINIKFPIDTYNKILSGSKEHNQTLTQYTNIIVEVYAQDVYKINTW